MDILLCQACGYMLRGQERICRSCGTPISLYASTAVPVMDNAPASLAHSLKPDPLALERVVTSRRLGTYALQEEETLSKSDKKPTEGNGASLGAASGGSKSQRAHKQRTDDGASPPRRKERDRKSNAGNFWDRTIKISISARAAITVVIVFFLAVLVLFAALATTFNFVRDDARKEANRTTQKPELPAVPDLSGIYDVTETTPIEPKRVWRLSLQQNGVRLSGRCEERGSRRPVEGKIEPGNKLSFGKSNMADKTKPLTYWGDYFIDSLGKPHLKGELAYQVRTTAFGKSSLTTVRGQWTAKHLLAVKADPGAEKPSTSEPQEDGKKFNIIAWLKSLTPAELSDVFLKAALGCVGTGMLAAFGALKLFGHSETLNIIAKKEYIPSQYKSQHNAMVREWTKPLTAGGVPLGLRAEWRPWKPWQARRLAMPKEARTVNPHMLVLGGSDQGKSRFLAAMIAHDIAAADRAVVVIDSDGELTKLVTRWAAAHPKGAELAKQITVLDPGKKGGALSYNPLELPEDNNMIDAASAVVQGFKAIYTEPPGSQSQWSQQTANILRNAALLLTANGKTLADLPTLLLDNDFRDILLEHVEKQKHERVEFAALLEQWGQYKRLARTDQWITWTEPILNRLTPLLSDPRLRPVLTKPAGDLKLEELIKSKHVLLVRIPVGQLDESANLLGSLLITGLKQAALSLAENGSSHPVALYVDELNNFASRETVEALTRETAKFQIGCVCAVKTLQQLPEDFRNQLLTNMGFICAFALAKKDADIIGPQIFRVDGRKIKHQTIQNFFNKVNTSPQFELISDEEKLNIDRVAGQEKRAFFCYRVGTVAGTYQLKTHDFNDIPEDRIKAKLIEQMHKRR
ncbi:MAG TPA: hypothetical protein V6D17_02915 [Candidatus Obscuribacterales bacterium]